MLKKNPDGKVTEQNCGRNRLRNNSLWKYFRLSSHSLENHAAFLHIGIAGREDVCCFSSWSILIFAYVGKKKCREEKRHFDLPAGDNAMIRLPMLGTMKLWQFWNTPRLFFYYRTKSLAVYWIPWYFLDRWCWLHTRWYFSWSAQVS